MNLLSNVQSALGQDKYKVHAAEVLMHIIANQQLTCLNGNGESAATYCSEFIVEMSKRLKEIAQSQN
jgi:hypothetical protein